MPDCIIPALALVFTLYYLTTITEVPWISQASAFVVSGLLLLSILAFVIRDDVIEAFAEAITALDDSMPNGTYIDMCSRLPLVDPKKILCPTIVMRGEYDGIASFDDLTKFYTALPNNDKQFCVMPGISHASFQQKNYQLVYHILYNFFSRPEPIYRGA